MVASKRKTKFCIKLQKNTDSTEGNEFIKYSFTEEEENRGSVVFYQ